MIIHNSFSKRFKGGMNEFKVHAGKSHYNISMGEVNQIASCLNLVSLSGTHPLLRVPTRFLLYNMQ